MSNLKERNDFGVFELGMSKKGEINSISKILKPDIAIITNISLAHSENFKNLKDIANAKAEIINNIKPHGTLLLNRDDKYYHYLARRAQKKNIQVKSFGLNRNADLYLKNIRKNKYNYIITISFENRKYLFRINYNSNTFIQNTLSTCLLIFVLNLDISNRNNIFLNFKIPEGRGDFSKVRASKIFFYLIDESYNANPNSVKLAINYFKSINKNKNKKILLLGDMLELGKRSKSLHRNLAKYINKSDIDKIFVIGNYVLETYRFIKKEKRGAIFNTINDVGSLIKNYVNNNDLVMIKGSNATGLNNFCKKLKKGIIDAV